MSTNEFIEKSKFEILNISKTYLDDIVMVL